LEVRKQPDNASPQPGKPPQQPFRRAHPRHQPLSLSGCSTHE
jgi:hypothetical protein